MKFLVGVKIRRKDDTLDKLNVCSTQKIPHGMPLSIFGNGSARISLEWKSPMRCLQFFIFMERSYSSSFSILLVVQSYKWSIEKKTCRNVTVTLKIFVCIIRLWTRYELKKLNGWSIVAVVNDILILFEIVISHTYPQVSSKFSLIF